MARPLRIEYPGAVYHITMRGNNRRIIFKQDVDRERFLLKLAESIQRFDIRLYLFCLMTNHVHLVLETPRGNLSRFMHRLLTAYTVYFNRRHNESGHLMQGRFGASVVDEDEYILKLSRYVHLNPVYVKKIKPLPVRERVEKLRAYPWSSYRSYIGKVKPLDFVVYEPVLQMMGRYKKRRQSQYRKFVETGIVDIDAAFIEAKERSRLCIGSDDCHDRVETKYHDRLDSFLKKEDVSFRQDRPGHAVDEIVSVLCQVFKVEPEILRQRRRGCYIRPISAKILCDYGGLTQRDVAEVLGVRSGVTVSLQIRKAEELLKDDSDLQTAFERIKKQLT